MPLNLLIARRYYQRRKSYKPATQEERENLPFLVVLQFAPGKMMLMHVASHRQDLSECRLEYASNRIDDNTLPLRSHQGIQYVTVPDGALLNFILDTYVIPIDTYASKLPV
jgi:hypothetical protein